MNRFFLIITLLTSVNGFCVEKSPRRMLYVSLYEKGVTPSTDYRPKKPLMWSALLKVDRAVVAGYEREIYSIGNILEFSAGVSVASMKKFGVKPDNIYMIGTYLMSRIYLIKRANYGIFFLYSPAGPSLLSKNNFVKTRFSNNFVFQDQFGFGISVDGRAKFELFAKMYHFSNGDIFSVNGGIDIPLMIGIGIKI